MTNDSQAPGAKTSAAIARANGCCQVKAVVIDCVTEALLAQMLALGNVSAMTDWLAACEAEDTRLPLADYLPPAETTATVAQVPKREVLRRYEQLSTQAVQFSRFVPYLASKLKAVQQRELASMCNGLISARAYTKTMPKPRHYAPTYT